MRYPLVGGTRQRCFDGTSFKLRKRLGNAARAHQSGARRRLPQSGVRGGAVLGGFYELKPMLITAPT